MAFLRLVVAAATTVAAAAAVTVLMIVTMVVVMIVMMAVSAMNVAVSDLFFRGFTDSNHFPHLKFRF